jgi:hypothetical protein
MARPPSPYRKTLVEDCEVISVSTAMGNLAIYGISFEYTPGLLSSCPGPFLLIAVERRAERVST